MIVQRVERVSREVHLVATDVGHAEVLEELDGGSQAECPSGSRK